MSIRKRQEKNRNNVRKGYRRNERKMDENTVLPLINSTFEPGHALEKAESFKDKNFRDIALSELYYFSGEAQKCSDLTEIYLMSPRLELQLSACMLYVYSNLTLGKARASRRGRDTIRECIKKEFANPTSKEHQAYCVFAGYMGAVLLHLPTDGLPDMKNYIADLPYGLRVFASYVMSHDFYLQGEYGKALGTCNTTLVFCDGTYPISMIYLYCMAAMCEISLKLMLLPFYIMRYEKKKYDMRKNPELLQVLLNEYDEIRINLEKELTETGKAELYTNLTKLIVKIADYIFEKDEDIRKGIGDVMGGKVLELESERLKAAGKAEGEAIGEARGQARLGNLINRLIQDQRMEEIQMASTDSEKREQLYKEYGI